MTLDGAVIVCISNIDWADNWQSQQEVASAFAAAGNRVLFVENTGVRSPRLRDLPRLLARLRNWRTSRQKPAVVAGVDLYSPLLVPLPYSRIAGHFNRKSMLRSIRRWLGKDPRPLVVITFLPTPVVRDVIDALAPALVVYYAVDCLSESSPGARPLRVHEEELFRKADVVFTTSDALRSFAQSLGAKPEMLAHGVRFNDFQKARRERGNSPALFDRLEGPVVGFAGSIRRELDLDLLAKVAARAPDLQFVFVGPVCTDVTALRSLPNVHFVAPVPHVEVTRYLARVDVGILPYVLNAFTAHIMPAKLKEFLAAGLPIVATGLPEIRLFAELHPGVVEFATDADSFVAALRSALATRGLEDVERRTGVAMRYDWGIQIDSMRTSMESALRARGARQ